jgi:hypothetical protein
MRTPRGSYLADSLRNPLPEPLWAPWMVGQGGMPASSPYASLAACQACGRTYQLGASRDPICHTCITNRMESLP